MLYHIRVVVEYNWISVQMYKGKPKTSSKICDRYKNRNATKKYFITELNFKLYFFAPH